MPQSASVKSSGCQFVQAMVDQRPKWDNQIVGRKSGVIRPNKRRKKRKYL